MYKKCATVYVVANIQLAGKLYVRQMFVMALFHI